MSNDLPGAYDLAKLNSPDHLAIGGQPTWRCARRSCVEFPRTMRGEPTDLEGMPATLEEELRREFRSIAAAQAVHRQGNTVPIHHVSPDLESPERRRRERAWRLESRRGAEDATALSAVWDSLVRIRTAAPSDLGTDPYPLLRSDEFGDPSLASRPRRRAHLAVEEFVTSVLVRLHERRRLQLGLRTIRPWDLYAAPPGFSTELLFGTMGEAVAAIESALTRVRDGADDPMDLQTVWGDSLRSDEETEHFLADYGVSLARARVPDHPREGRDADAVAAVALPLLVLHGAPDPAGTSSASSPLHRARIRHLERCLLRWTFGAMIDAFEDWTYSHAARAQDPVATGVFWSSLWLRFLPAVDWTGLEEELGVEWQRHDALFLNPGESVHLVWQEIEVFRSWSLATDQRTWFQELDPFGQLAGDHAPEPAAITDQEVLDVARLVEDSIETLEGRG